MENLLIPAILIGSYLIGTNRKQKGQTSIDFNPDNTADTVPVGVGALKKPRLKSGDTVYIESYSSKPDIYGNPYNAGDVYILSKGKYNLIGSWNPNYGGKDMARQNAFDVLDKKTYKPYGVSNFSTMQLRNKNISVQQNHKVMPIRKFNKQFK